MVNTNEQLIRFPCIFNSFGLPGLLCLMGTDRDQNDPPIEIYGPEGLRMWLRVAIRYSVSRVVPPYRVHELMDGKFRR